jgi:hypothetical protein
LKRFLTPFCLFDTFSFSDTFFLPLWEAKGPLTTFTSLVIFIEVGADGAEKRTKGV